MTGDDDVFRVLAFSTGSNYPGFGINQTSGYMTFDFDANSGTYKLLWDENDGIVFTGNWTGYAHVEDKAGNTGAHLIDVACIQEAESPIYAIPGYRPLDLLDMTGTVSIYHLSGGSYEVYDSQEVPLSTTGLGSAVMLRPPFGTDVYTTIESVMHLSGLGFSGVYQPTSPLFDFTILTGLDNSLYVTGYYNRVNLDAPINDVKSLLVPGDVAKDLGFVIDGLDLLLINNNLTRNNS